MILGVIEMSSGTIGCHARLAGTFVGAHLQGAVGVRVLLPGSKLSLGLKGSGPCPGSGTDLQPDDALAGLHGGIVKVPLLFL